CRIGEKRLMDAIAQLPEDIAVEVQLKPFELNPDMPKEGIPRRMYRTMKFGSWERSQQLDAGTIAAGAPDGVTFNYDAMERTPNSFAAHKLTRWAEGQGPAQVLDLAHGLLKAYFVEGRDIGDPAVLVAVAEETGLDGQAAKAYLDNPETDGETRKALADAARAGVSGVPQFDIGDLTLRGAQPAPYLLDAILSAAQAQQQPSEG
ncbi:MAG: DsbA family oxidoreductase, partial [Rhodospirillaceae bacterium]